MRISTPSTYRYLRCSLLLDNSIAVYSVNVSYFFIIGVIKLSSAVEATRANARALGVGNEIAVDVAPVLQVRAANRYGLSETVYSIVRPFNLP